MIRLGLKADLFDVSAGTSCGIRPCAWGASNGFPQAVVRAGLDPVKYVLERPGAILLNDIRVKAELCTFSKPRFIRDLLEGADVRYEPPSIESYDRVIDASGVSRAYLPPAPGDILLPCVQFRIRTDVKLENQAKLGGIGYAWCFPLSPNEYHVGCGSFLRDPRKVLSDLGWLERMKSTSDILCACHGKIRLTGPHASRPFVVDSGGVQIWGIGEAIGCVAPLAGDGILSGMRSVELLLECWEDPKAYCDAILKEFHWMEGEREVLEVLRKKAPLGLGEARVLKRNSARMGMNIGLRQAFLLLKSLR
jgi:hypothetical protein